MPSCVIRFCKNYTPKLNKSSGITFHRFPQDKLQEQKWVKFVRVDRSEMDWMPNASSRICSDHFAKEMFYTTKNGLCKLNKDALPSKKLEQSAERLSEQEASTSEIDADISDLNSIFDTPAIYYLKNKLRKITMQKRKLMLENKLLKQKNKRLSKKCESIQNVVQVLKKQKFLQEDQYIEITVKAEAADFQESL